MAALRYLFPQGQGGDVDILTILRGGLNYPLEEACYRNGIRVSDIHFVSCERIIEDHVITGLEIKYEKLRVAQDRILLIGDIIATGDTLRLCLDQVVDRFRRRGGSIRKIIFFTVGGTRAIDLMEKKAEEIRRVFPDFEGFECFFYEGIFTVYENQGASGINVPDIDFGWKGGVVSPEFQRYVMGHPYSLLEKCIIYDGGARRYEIPVHFHEVLEYWEGVWGRADRIDPVRLAGEKLGFYEPVTFQDWLTLNHFQDLKDEKLAGLWAEETEFLKNAAALSLETISTQRITAINNLLQQYE
jgi:hypoxanthine-guanine phosphoribosyltransferase